MASPLFQDSLPVSGRIHGFWKIIKHSSTKANLKCLEAGCVQAVHERPPVKFNVSWGWSVFSGLWLEFHTLREQQSPSFLGCFNLHMLVGRNISLGIFQGLHSLPECDLRWSLGVKMPRRPNNLIYLISVPWPKGIPPALVEILAGSSTSLL